MVKLEQNYRSTQTILDADQRDHRQQPRPEAEAAVDRRRAAATRSRIAELGDEHAEARYVAGEIERLAGEEGVPRTEIAVFYRTNAQSRVLEDTLVRFDVPYQVIGGTKFYERAEIKDAIAYLTAARQPGRRGLVRAHRQLAAARDRPDDPGAAALAREHDGTAGLGGRASAPRTSPGSGRRRSRP